MAKKPYRAKVDARCVTNSRQTAAFGENLRQKLALRAGSRQWNVRLQQKYEPAHEKYEQIVNFA